MFVIVESLFRKNPYLNSEIIDVLGKNTEVYVENDVQINDDEEFIKIKYNDKEGFIIRSSLGDKPVDLESKDQIKIKKENKLKIINEVFKIINQNTSYSSKLDNKFYDNGKTRANGYYNIPYEEDGKKIFSYDCSAFCSCIINRAFNVDMKRKGKGFVQITDEIKKPNLWVTKDFLENAKGNEEKIFLITDHAEKEDETINATNLEIGDFIIGIIDYDNIKHDKRYIMNHIMVYIGDSYIAHASFSNGVDVFNRVLFTKITDDFYTRVSFNRRFDKEIAVVRYIDK